MRTALYDSYTFRKFMGINFLEQDVPDATTLLHFRHLLEENGLNKLFFDAINQVMVVSGHMMKGETIGDARAQLHEECGEEAGHGDAPDEKRRTMALWNEMPYRRRCGRQTGSHHRGHCGK